MLPLFWVAFATALLWATPADAAPIVAAIGAVAGAIGTAWAAVGAWLGVGAGLWASVGRVLISLGANILFSKLFAPKRANVGQRQAQTLELTLGESPREAIFGRAATGGTLMNAWNDGAENEFETMVVALADHECDAIEGFYRDDTYYTLTTQGAQTHADFQDGGPRLWIEWRLGAPGQTLPSIIATQGVAADEYTGDETFAGLTYIVVRYKTSDKVWKSGRPRWRFVVRGLKCYDPRLDDTVEGGVGAHRWGDPTTYEWSENARVCHYNFIRGVWNYASDPPQLMVGPGRSAEEAPPEEAIADMNLCDEDVALKAGGTEPRYRVGGVIRADERWIDVEEHFAAAMAGQLVERGGMIGIDPGAAKSTVFTFTDGELLRGQEMAYQAKVGRAELTNTVVTRYVDPAQLWEQASAPLRRSAEDIAEDGEARELSLELVLVTSGTQAQRCGEIARRRARLQASAMVPLGPAYMTVEDGDWGTWTSERRFGGATVSFEAQGIAHDGEGRAMLAIKQIASSVYSWDEDVDELDADAPAYLPPGGLPDAELAGFAVAAITITTDSEQVPAIKVNWTPPTDVSIRAILIEWRKADTPSVVSSATTDNVASGEHIISSGLIGGAAFEVRITPIPAPVRDAVATAWATVTVDEFASSASLPFTPVKTDNTRVIGRSLRMVDPAVDTPMEWTSGDAVLWDDSDDLLWDAVGWDGQVFSAESYAGGATALAIAVYDDTALAFGLSSDPAASTHFEAIDFCWHLGEDGKRRIYESGVLAWDNSGAPEDYAASDVFSVIYDNAHVRYYVSGVLKREVAADSGLTLHFASSYYTDGGRLDGVSFTTTAQAGQSYQTRYKRSVAPPATPTDADPADWSTAIPAGDAALWATTATFSASGALLGPWSTPVLRSSPNWRGAYQSDVTYYREDGVTHNGGSYRCSVESVTGQAPSGTAQDTSYWACIAAPGAAGSGGGGGGGGFSATIDIASSATGVNLYDLAVAAGYGGDENTTITFEIESGVTITGIAGAPHGGVAIDTGIWPTGFTHDLALVIKSGAIVRGGGGKGGYGSRNANNGEIGGNGGDAIRCRVDIDVTINSGAEVKGGGGGGGGGRGYQFSYFTYGAGGGGGGQPNGPGGAGGDGSNGDGVAGTAGTTAAPGEGGAGAGAANAGRDGGAYGAAGEVASGSGNPGEAGYCVRKGGYTVNVTNNGTTAGAIG